MRQYERNGKKSLGRRFRFSVAVLGAQLLLIGTAVAWCVHMALIRVHGEVCFAEPNAAILNAEIAVTVLVIVYSATVFALQWRRLSERRKGDRPQ